MLIRNEAGELHHVEFQATNDPEFGFRMLDYWVYFRREYSQPVIQSVFYVGRDPMRLAPIFEERETRHGFTIVNLQDYDAADLLASPDWGDNLWSLGAQGDPEVILTKVLDRLRALPPSDQPAALAELTTFSGILKLDHLLGRKLEERPMLEYDLTENAVVRPLIEKGRQEGRYEASYGTLRTLLQDRFGTLPTWATEAIDSASLEQIELWTRRILHSKTLEDNLSS